MKNVVTVIAVLLGIIYILVTSAQIGTSTGYLGRSLESQGEALDIQRRAPGHRSRTMLDRYLRIAGRFRVRSRDGPAIFRLDARRFATYSVRREVALPRGSRRPTCPVAALEQWLARSEISEGTVFRGVSRHGKLAAQALTPTAVALIVKERALAAWPRSCDLLGA
jgi:hypothetical protein